MSKVLVIIKSPGIGDLCILSKYIQEISKYSSSEVSVLAQQNTRAHEILKNDPHVKEVIELDKKGFFKTIQKIKPKKFDRSYIYSDSIRLYLISKLSGIKHIFHYNFFSKKGKNFFKTAKEFTENIINIKIDSQSKIYNVLIPKGKLLLSTPNLYSIYNIGRFITGKGINNGFVEFNKLNTIGHMGHIREYTVKEMIDFLSDCGFINIEILRFSTKTREGVTLGKILKNFTTDLIETLVPRVKSQLFIIAEKPNKFGINK